MIKDKIRHYNIGEKEYPKKLANISSPPKQLYVLGSLPDPNKPTMAIVGARNATPYGKKVAWEFAKTLSDHGIQIISGFARGIDRAGHEGALAGKTPSFAVLGNGVDICYPRENIDLYPKLMERGGFISEFSPGAKPLPRHFPSRNRIISAISDKILIVEARERSGSLITADFGLEQGKDIYALPGRITDTASQGCHRLIMQGATIAISVEEILRDFEIDVINWKRFNENTKLALAKDEKTVYSCIGLEPKHVEDIQIECKLEMSILISLLLQLELNGFIREVSRNVYIRI